MFDIVPNSAEMIERMKTAELLESIGKAEQILDLSVIGMLNTEYRADPDALYWVQHLYRDLVRELVRRAEKQLS